MVEESLIEVTKSRLSDFDLIDEANRSILKDHVGLSQSGIECDLIRIDRLEDERLRRDHDANHEKLFTESHIRP